MGGCILAFLLIKSLPITIVFLLLIGALGGIYIVPMNASLQQVGHRTVGEGKTIAVQNFLENSFMCVGVGLYTLAAQKGVATHLSIGATGAVFLMLVSYIFMYYRNNLRRSVR
jgi:LPLT family lysophospholipid transporter-like MFS transporter